MNRATKLSCKKDKLTECIKEISQPEGRTGKTFRTVFDFISNFAQTPHHKTNPYLFFLKEAKFSIPYALAEVI